MDIKAITTQSALDMYMTNTELDHLAAGRSHKEDGKRDFAARQELIKKMADNINQNFLLFNSSLKIEIDEQTHIQVVKVLNDESKQVIRQIPPEAMLQIARYLDKITKVLFEQKA